MNIKVTAMQLIDVTSSYAETVRQQLIKTSAHFIKIYTLGNSRIVFRKKQNITEIIISNRIRPVTDKEINYVEKELLKDQASKAFITKQGKLVEINLNA